MACHPEPAFTSAQEERLCVLIDERIHAAARRRGRVSATRLRDFLSFPVPAAPVLSTAGGRDPTGGASLPCAAGELVDQRASDRDADGTRCGGEAITVHDHGDTL